MTEGYCLLISLNYTSFTAYVFVFTMSGSKLYRKIQTFNDHILLQKDLTQLGKWANTWGMNFNTNKCHILSIKNKTQFFYSLNNETLEYVTTNPYLGITISNDLKWHSHISTITKKANSTLGFLRRNIRRCPINSKRTAYIALVRAVLEYGAIVWDPYHRGGGGHRQIRTNSTPCSSFHHWRLPL